MSRNTKRDKAVAHAQQNADGIKFKFVEEVDRLCRSGAVTEDTPDSVIFAVALENIAKILMPTRVFQFVKEAENLRKF